LAHKSGQTLACFSNEDYKIAEVAWQNFEWSARGFWTRILFGHI